MARNAPQEIKISYDINKIREFIPCDITIKFHYFNDEECGEEDIHIDSVEELLDNDFNEYIKEQIEAPREVGIDTSYVSLWYNPHWNNEQEIKIQDIWKH